MKNTIKIAVGGALLVIAAGVAGTYTIHRGFSARDEPSAPEIAAAHFARRLATPSSARTLKSQFAVTPEGLAEARQNWAQNCANCHGVNGDGQTEIGRNLYPKPPDLRGATQKLADGELYLTIQNGIRLSAMPAWGEVRDDDRDRWNLVALIRRLPKLTPEEVKEIEGYLPRSGELEVPTSRDPEKKTSAAGNKTRDGKFHQ